MEKSKSHDQKRWAHDPTQTVQFIKDRRDEEEYLAFQMLRATLRVPMDVKLIIRCRIGSLLHISKMILTLNMGRS